MTSSKSNRGASELLVVAIVGSLIILLMLALLPSLLNTVSSEAQKDSGGQDKESALCTGDNCTDCAPGDTNCFTTSTTTTSTSSPGPGPGCFTGDTMVMMADGTLKRIDKIQVDDQVLAANDVDNAYHLIVQAKRVKRVFVHDPQQVYLLTVEGESLAVTAIHPFYALGQGWTRLQDLEIGDIIASAAGEARMVLAITPLPEWETVYDLQIEGSPTFFVGQSMLWVHNKVPGPTPGPGGVSVT